MKSLLPWLFAGAVAAAVAYGLLAPPRASSSAVAVPSAMPVSPDEAHAELPAAPREETMPAPQPETTLTGTVREVHDVSQYTYLRLDTGSGEAWAAVYRAPVAVGTKVTLEHATSLEHFHSRELERDFDRIWFGVLPGYEKAPPLPSASSSAKAHGSASAPSAASNVKPVPGAMPIADLFAHAAALEGKPVTISGRVVKENDGILGKNWIHLQDGSGNADAGTNDVLVTSEQTARVGDPIVATGKVRLNQDFGAGYAYPVLVEEASFKGSDL